MIPLTLNVRGSALWLTLALAFVSVAFTGVSHAQAEGLTTLDECIKERGGDAFRECNAEFATGALAEGITGEDDSTDLTSSSAEFRFAGTGLLSEMLGEPYDAGTGLYDYRGADGCMKWEFTIKKAQYKREDGVVSEMPLLDENGDQIPGDDLFHGDDCQAVVKWEEDTATFSRRSTHTTYPTETCKEGKGGMECRNTIGHTYKCYSYRYTYATYSVVRRSDGLVLESDRRQGQTVSVNTSDRQCSYPGYPSQIPGSTRRNYEASWWDL